MRTCTLHLKVYESGSQAMPSGLNRLGAMSGDSLADVWQCNQRLLAFSLQQVS